MAIRFQCSACSQPIEVDEEWAQRLVACPYCRKTITTPAETAQVDLAEIPTASPLGHADVTLADFALPQQSAELPALPSNQLAKVAFGLACAVLVFVCLYGVLGSIHRLELEPLLQPDRTFAEQMEAFQDYAASRGGNLPAWLVGMSLLSFSAGLAWLATLVCGIISVRRPVNRSWAVAALIIAGLMPVVFCCGGLALAQQG